MKKTAIDNTIIASIAAYTNALDLGKRNSKDTTAKIHALEEAGWEFLRPSYKEGVTVVTPWGEKLHAESVKKHTAIELWPFDPWMAYRRIMKAETMEKALLILEGELFDDQLRKRADKELLAKFAKKAAPKKAAPKKAQKTAEKTQKEGKKTMKKTAEKTQKTAIDFANAIDFAKLASLDADTKALVLKALGIETETPKKAAPKKAAPKKAQKTQKNNAPKTQKNNAPKTFTKLENWIDKKYANTRVNCYGEIVEKATPKGAEHAFDMNATTPNGSPVVFELTEEKAKTLAKMNKYVEDHDDLYMDVRCGYHYVKGNTKEHKAELKAMGLHWSSQNTAWQFEPYTKKYRKGTVIGADKVAA